MKERRHMISKVYHGRDERENTHYRQHRKQHSYNTVTTVPRTVEDDLRILFECAGHIGSYDKRCMYCDSANGISQCTLGIGEGLCNRTCAYHPDNDAEAGRSMRCS